MVFWSSTTFFEIQDILVRNFAVRYDFKRAYLPLYIVVFKDKLYYCKTATTGVFDVLAWGELKVYDEGVNYVVNDLVLKARAGFEGYVDLAGFNSFMYPGGYYDVYRCTGATTGEFDVGDWVFSRVLFFILTIGRYNNQDKEFGEPRNGFLGAKYSPQNREYGIFFPCVLIDISYIKFQIQEVEGDILGILKVMFYVLLEEWHGYLNLLEEQRRGMCNEDFVDYLHGVMDGKSGTYFENMKLLFQNGDVYYENFQTNVLGFETEVSYSY